MRTRLAASAVAAFGTLSLLAAAGCSELNRSSAKAEPLGPQHPAVVVQGVDGTVMTGELLNGSITVDSGQGELTLLTDHITSLTLAQDVDKLDSNSIKVTGKVKDTKFFLKNEHGVLTLSKDRLRKIEFVNAVNASAPAGSPAPSAPSPTVKATAYPAR